MLKCFKKHTTKKRMFTLNRREPRDDELLVYTVTSIHHKEGFARVSLPDYGNMEAMLPFTHLSRKRSSRSVKKYLSVGRKDVGRVLVLEYGPGGACHPTLTRAGVEDDERAKALDDFGQRSRLVKWCVYLAHQMEGKTSHQGLFEYYILPLSGLGQEAWISLRDVPAAQLAAEGGPWCGKTKECSLAILQRANDKFFPKPPVKVTVNFEARGVSVDALRAFGVYLEDARPDLVFTLVSPPHYTVTKDKVDIDQVDGLTEEIRTLLQTPFKGVRVKLH